MIFLCFVSVIFLIAESKLAKEQAQQKRFGGETSVFQGRNVRKSGVNRMARSGLYSPNWFSMCGPWFKHAEAG
ncbi:hypothetical protein [Spirosoma sp. KNUC1025]|uniref:hypothetical protein n=1 Tax=Spirosoma sp. KNUC1025 TaxID=2894082 RepID=UPI003867BB5D|nr:hypothetical protein LN737_31730 [Spirosoma sp. KNUC1025]